MKTTKKAAKSAALQGPSLYAVFGSIRHAAGIGPAGVTVVVYKQKLKTAVELAAGKPGKNGEYRLEYISDGEPMHVFVSVFDKKKVEIARSRVHYHIGSIVEIHIELPALPQKMLSEYERLLAALTPHLDGAVLHELSREEFEFLAQASVQDKLNIERAVQAAKLAKASSGLPESLLYALLKQGQPNDLYMLALTPEAKLLEQINKAVSDGLLNPMREKALKKCLNAFRESAIDQVLSKEEGLGLLLKIAAVPAPEARRAVALGLPDNFELPAFWETLRQNGVFRDSKTLTDLEFAQTALQLTQQNSALTSRLLALKKERAWAEVTDLVRLNNKEWTKLTKEIPEAGEKRGFVTVAKAMDKQAYIAQIQANIARLWPSAFIARQLLAVKDPEWKSVGQFIEANPEFDLFKTRSAEATLIVWAYQPDPAKAEALLSGLQSVQRLARLAPDTNRMEAMQALKKAGFGSARAIVEAGEPAFLSKTGEILGEIQARNIFKRALSIREANLHALMALRDRVAPDNVALKPIPSASPEWINTESDTTTRQRSINDAPDASIPDWPTLFGSLNACACQHCRSVYSPAAYFVDLMEYLGKFVTNVSGAYTNLQTEIQINPKHNLEGMPRRLDLKTLALSCDNTSRLVPYIDLVNELLEIEIEAWKTKGQTNPGARVIILLNYYKFFFNTPDASSYSDEKMRALPQIERHEAYRNVMLHKVYQEYLNGACYPWHSTFNLLQEYVNTFEGISGADLNEVSRLFITDTWYLAKKYFRITEREFDWLSGRREPDNMTDRQYILSLWGIEFNGTDNGIPLTLVMNNTGWDYSKTVRFLKSEFLKSIDTQLSIEESSDFDLNKYSLRGLKSVKDFQNVYSFFIFLHKTGWEIEEMEAILPLCIEFALKDASWIDLKSDGISQLTHLLFRQFYEADRIWEVFNISINELIALSKGEISMPKAGNILQLPVADTKVVLHLHDFSLSTKNTLGSINSLLETTRVIREILPGVDLEEIWYILTNNDTLTSQYKPDETAITTLLSDLDNSQEPGTQEYIDRLARFLNVEDKRVVDLLVAGDSSLLYYYSESGKKRPAINGFNEYISLPDKNTADTENAVAFVTNLYKATRLIKILSLDFHSIGVLGLFNPSIANIFDFQAIGDNEESKIRDVKNNFFNLLTFRVLQSKYKATNIDFSALVHDLCNSSPTTATDTANIIQFRTGWEAAGMINILQLFSAGDYWKLSLFRKVHEVRSLQARFGISSVDELKELIKSTAFAFVTPLAERLAAEQKDLTIIFNRLNLITRNKYPDDKILYKTITPYMDRLRERKRDALLQYLIHHTDAGFRSPADVYNHLLLDPEMNACMLTSRIKQAISSVQLFIQRVRMNLEPASAWALGDQFAELWQQWEWRKNYRVWEANRKVFLYPENWIEPELRDDKTPIYKTLEEELMQDELTNETAERAFMNYLLGLNEVARLEVRAICNEKNQQGDIVKVHVFARTYNQPHKYFYRYLTIGKGWSPWEDMNVDVDGEYLAPAAYQGNLYLFFAKKETKEIEYEVAGDQPLYLNNNAFIHNATTKRKTIVFYVKKIKYIKREFLQWSTPKSIDIVYNEENSPRQNLMKNELTVKGYKIKYKKRKNTPDKTYRILHRVGEAKECLINDVGEVIEKIIESNLEEIAVGKEYTVEISKSEAKNEEENGEMWEYYDAIFAKYSISQVYRHPDLLFSQSKFEDFLIYAYGEDDNIILKVDTLSRNLADNRSHVTNANLVTINNFTQVDPLNRFTSGSLDGVVSNVILYEKNITAIRPLILKFNNTIISYGRIIYPIINLLNNENDSYIIFQDLKSAYFVKEKIHDNRDDWEMKLFSHPLIAELVKILINKNIPFSPLKYIHENYPIQLRYKNFNLEGNIQLENNEFLIYYNPDDTIINKVSKDVCNIFDFSSEGPYALYNWELFFHIPFHLATQFSRNQQFETAQKWFHYIFNPTIASKEPAPQRYWLFRPFYELAKNKQIETLDDLLESAVGNTKLESQVETWENNSFNPHAIARDRLVAYMKSVVIKYLDNLIAWGDQLFMRDTIESINEATQLYVLALELLGNKPVFMENKGEKQLNYTDFEMAKNANDPYELDLFSNHWEHVGTTYYESNGPGYAFVGVDKVYHPYFCIPTNEKLLEYWDKVADRMFKIRNCMNIEGQRRSLALFEPPIDPALLVRAKAMGLSLDSVLADLYAPASSYRYAVLQQKAAEFTSHVISLGNALLSALEKKDAEDLVLLRARHERELLKEVRQIKQRQIEELQENIAGLEKSKELAEQKKEYYGTREFISSGESTQISMGQESFELQSIAQGLEAGAAALRFIPDLFNGTSGNGAHSVVYAFGGTMLAEAMSLSAKGLNIHASSLQHKANHAGALASYQRRKDDWDFQRDLAAKEIEQVEKQLLAAEIRLAIAEKELENHEKQMEQSDELWDYYQSKFTNKQLYNWMTGQLSGLHYQAYKLAYEMARKVEKAAISELCLESESDFSYIRPDSWDGLKKGLLAGEKLLLQLHRLEAGFMDKYLRLLEITKHISLQQLDPLALLELRETGKCAFGIPEMLFDMDFPGHYFRRIKSVSITIPCIAGPYTGVNATLRLIEHITRRKPKKPEKPETPEEAPEKGQSQITSIATSSAQNDSGLFELNFRDERYLPFEGAGAVSFWAMELPQFRQFDYHTISDVILHLRYTAKEDGALKEKVQQQINTEIDLLSAIQHRRLFSLRTDFPNEWRRWKSGNTPQLKVKLEKHHFPFFAQAGEITLNKAEVWISVDNQQPIWSSNANVWELEIRLDTTAKNAYLIVTYDLGGNPAGNGENPNTGGTDGGGGSSDGSGSSEGSQQSTPDIQAMRVITTDYVNNSAGPGARYRLDLPDDFNRKDSLLFIMPEYDEKASPYNTRSDFAFVFWQNDAWWINSLDVHPVLIWHVVACRPGNNVFRHTTTTGNLYKPDSYTIKEKYATTIDHRSLNGNPEAIIFVTQLRREGEYAETGKDHHHAVWYDPEKGRWAIVFPSRFDMPEGTEFNVLIADSSKTLRHVVNRENLHPDFETVSLFNNQAVKQNNILLVTEFWPYTLLVDESVNVLKDINIHPCNLQWFPERHQWGIFRLLNAKFDVNSQYNLLVI